MAGMVQHRAHQEPQKKQMKVRTMDMAKLEVPIDETEDVVITDLGCSATTLPIGLVTDNEGGGGGGGKFFISLL